MKKPVPSIAWLAAVCVLVAEARVQAYLDPGSTSLILQGIVGGIAAALVLLRSHWRRIASLFRRPGRRNGGNGSTTG